MQPSLSANPSGSYFLGAVNSAGQSIHKAQLVQRVKEYGLRDFAPKSAHRTAAAVAELANGAPASLSKVSNRLHASKQLGNQRLRRAALFGLVVKDPKIPGGWWPAGKIVAKR